MLPSYARALQDHGIGGKGKVFNAAAPPARICVICGKANEHKIKIEEQETFCLHCADCQRELDAGYTALRSPDHRYAFVKHPELPAGKTLTISVDVMNQVKQRMDHGKTPDAA